MARHFHLGFKGMEEEEVYNVLMEQLIATINKYDPFYTEKVKRVVEVIEHELRARKKQFSAADLNRYLDFDTHRHLRMLCRRWLPLRIPAEEKSFENPAGRAACLSPNSQRLFSDHAH